MLTLALLKWAAGLLTVKKTPSAARCPVTPRRHIDPRLPQHHLPRNTASGSLQMISVQRRVSHNCRNSGLLECWKSSLGAWSLASCCDGFIILRLLIASIWGFLVQDFTVASFAYVCPSFWLKITVANSSWYFSVLSSYSSPHTSCDSATIWQRRALIISLHRQRNWGLEISSNSLAYSEVSATGKWQRQDSNPGPSPGPEDRPQVSSLSPCISAPAVGRVL